MTNNLHSANMPRICDLLHRQVFWAFKIGQTGAARQNTKQQLQLGTVMAEGMCLCMDGVSASPNGSCAMQLKLSTLPQSKRGQFAISTS